MRVVDVEKLLNWVVRKMKERVKRKWGVDLRDGEFRLKVKDGKFAGVEDVFENWTCVENLGAV